MHARRSLKVQEMLLGRICAVMERAERDLFVRAAWMTTCILEHWTGMDWLDSGFAKNVRKCTRMNIQTVC
jgi:hypothetical protein